MQTQNKTQNQIDYDEAQLQNDEAIDAVFVPAPAPNKPALRGPGWLAFGALGLLSLINLIVTLLISGHFPGLPHQAASQTASSLAALRLDIDQLKSQTVSAQRDMQTKLASLDSELRLKLKSGDSAPQQSAQRLKAVLGNMQTLQAEVSALENRLAEIEAGPQRPIQTGLSRLADPGTNPGNTIPAQSASAAQAPALYMPNEALLALSDIEASIRTGRPFLASFQKLSAALPGRPELESISLISITGVPTLASLTNPFPKLRRKALDREAKQLGGGASWLRSIFGEGVRVRRTGVIQASDLLDRAGSALANGNLSLAVNNVEALPADLKPVFTDWLIRARERQKVETLIERLRASLSEGKQP